MTFNRYILLSMTRAFVEVTIRTNVDSGELLAMLHGAETLGAWEKDGFLCIYWPEGKWTPQESEDLKRALAVLGVEERESDFIVRTIPDTNWNATWAASLHPIRLGRRIWIRQSWNSIDTEFDCIELVIDPKNAFGTGYHATTQLVIEWLETHIHGGERVLDIGTGSGILAMAAIRLGADSALAVDNDPIALECAQEYSRVNGFGPELELRAASFAEINAEPFDVIVANLDGKTLPLLSTLLPRLLGTSGIACLSGMQQQDYEEIAGSLTKAGLKIKASMERGDWLALAVCRK
jgi:ribosomal protein L11 methyltransferase